MLFPLAAFPVYISRTKFKIDGESFVPSEYNTSRIGRTIRRRAISPPLEERKFGGEEKVVVGYHPFLSEVIECSNSVGWYHTVTFYFARTYVRTYLRSCLRGKKRERAASRSIEREREIFSLPISVWNNREREREKRKGGKRSFCFLLRNIIIA